MIEFPHRPKTDELPDLENGRYAVVEVDYCYESIKRNCIVLVRQGYCTDWASIPRLFRAVISPRGKHSPAALIHDWLYASKAVLRIGGDLEGISRGEADAIFMEAMEAISVPFLRRQVMHKAVRLGGWIAWRKETFRRLSDDGNEIERIPSWDH